MVPHIVENLTFTVKEVTLIPTANNISKTAKDVLFFLPALLHNPLLGHPSLHCQPTHSYSLFLNPFFFLISYNTLLVFVTYSFLQHPITPFRLSNHPFHQLQKRCPVLYFRATTDPYHWIMLESTPSKFSLPVLPHSITSTTSPSLLNFSILNPFFLISLSSPTSHCPSYTSANDCGQWTLCLVTLRPMGLRCRGNHRLCTAENPIEYRQKPIQCWPNRYEYGQIFL